ncbi:MAG: hypothetical protein AB7U36_07425 [Desulfobacter sp.]
MQWVTEDIHLACLNIQGPAKHGKQCGFAAAGRANHEDHLSNQCSEINLFENGRDLIADLKRLVYSGQANGCFCAIGWL